MDHPACRRVDHQRRAFGNGMRHRQEADPERSGLYLFGPGRNGAHAVFGQAQVSHLAPRDIGGKGTGVNRRAKRLVAVGDATDMVFMRVGDEHRFQPVGAFLQPGHVGQDQVDPRSAFHIGKRDAQIDQDQTFLARSAPAVDIGIHADFPGSAQWQIDQSFTAHVLCRFPCYTRISPSARASLGLLRNGRTGLRIAGTAAPARQSR